MTPEQFLFDSTFQFRYPALADVMAGTDYVRQLFSVSPKAVRPCVAFALG